MDVHEFFQALSDETRLRCLTLIAMHGELCVCELNVALDVSQPKVSRHLAILRANRILKQRREGQWSFYSLSPDLSDFERKIIEMLVQEKQSKALLDNKRLGQMKKRPGGVRC